MAITTRTPACITATPIMVASEMETGAERSHSPIVGDGPIRDGPGGLSVTTTHTGCRCLPGTAHIPVVRGVASSTSRLPMPPRHRGIEHANTAIEYLTVQSLPACGGLRRWGHLCRCLDHLIRPKRPQSTVRRRPRRLCSRLLLRLPQSKRPAGFHATGRLVDRSQYSGELNRAGQSRSTQASAVAFRPANRCNDAVVRTG
jgi:hypothetical protein